jgi:hypothetical protein
MAASDAAIKDLLLSCRIFGGVKYFQPMLFVIALRQAI